MLLDLAFTNKKSPYSRNINRKIFITKFLSQNFCDTFGENIGHGRVQSLPN